MRSCKYAAKTHRLICGSNQSIESNFRKQFCSNKKRPSYQSSDTTVFLLSLLSDPIFYFFTHFEIVTKFLQILCIFMILSSCDNVNIFAVYLRRFCHYCPLFLHNYISFTSSLHITKIFFLHILYHSQNIPYHLPTHLRYIF